MAAPAAPPLRYITFASDDPAYNFTAQLGDGQAKVTDGYAGWEVQARARRRGLAEWRGNNPLTIDIPIVFNNRISNDGITTEAAIRQLEKMAGLDLGLREPPIVHFNAGGAVPHDAHDASDTDWVISAIAWGDADLNTSGNRIWQPCTVTVMQRLADDLLKVGSSASRNRDRSIAQTRAGSNKKGAAHKTHHVQPGETLSTIARDELGDSTRWRDIAAKNPVNGKPRRDPKSVKPGETLVMP